MPSVFNFIIGSLGVDFKYLRRFIIILGQVLVNLFDIA